MGHLDDLAIAFGHQDQAPGLVLDANGLEARMEFTQTVNVLVRGVCSSSTVTPYAHKAA